MRITASIVTILVLLVVASFQACSPLSAGSNSQSDRQSLDRLDTTNQAPIGASENNAIPFHGKLSRSYQSRDENFCKSLNHTQPIRQEIVRDALGSWLTIDNCVAVSARNVASKILANDDRSQLLFAGQILNEANKVNPLEHARLSCYYEDGTLGVVVYESADGLALDYPPLRNVGQSDFAAVTATHRVLPSPAPHPSNFTYDETYNAAFWNKDFRGKYNLYLNTQDPKNITGMWYLVYSGTAPARGGRGPCKVEQSKYSW